MTKKSLKIAVTHKGICKNCKCGKKEQMEVKKTKVAAIKFCLGADGGSEKFLQTIIAHLPKDKFEVDAYYTNAASYLGSDWQHPDNNPQNLERLKKAGVNLIPVHVEHKDVRIPTHDWVGTNFFELFDESKYDVVMTVRAGHKEFPYHLITKTPIIEIVTLPGMADRQGNIFKSVHISNFQKNSWVAAGGDESKAIVVPIVSDLPKQSGQDMRKELGIDSVEGFVFGFHQREDDGIFSPVSLEAYKKIMNDKTWFVIMGGSKLYSKFAESNGLKNFIQLPFSGDDLVKDQFLATLDVYAHARRDGETFGLAIAEAMSYGLPVLSHAAPAMGHVETIGDAGFVCNTVDEYADYMAKLLTHGENLEGLKFYGTLADHAVHRYTTEYSVPAVVDKFLAIFDEIEKEKLKDTMSDEDFWTQM
jgi:glycosyltransferase involved in cell wall biosynthesis